MPSVPPTPRRSPHFPLDRRSFLVAGGLSYLGTNLAAPVLAAPRLAGNRTAKSAILIFLSGGASHIDTWDPKPALAKHGDEKLDAIGGVPLPRVREAMAWASSPRQVF